MSRASIDAALAEAAAALERLRRDATALAAIDAAGELLARCLAAGGRVISCGNGGSMCDAMHFAEEMSGRFREDRPALAAIAIGDPGHLSCVANDYGYEQVFARFVQAHGRAGDVLLAISTSGSSPNVLAAARAARAQSMAVIALTGRADAPLAALAQVAICTPGGRYADRVQELHIKVIHMLIELVEERLGFASRPGPHAA
ncbi:MAG TPA: SIS domain-containing protein [Burkholderiaceae bacterium]